MVKHWYLSLKAIQMLYKRSKSVFLIFIIMQMFTCMGLTFFFTTIYSARENYVRQTESARTLRVTPPSNFSAKTTEGKIESLANQSSAKIQNITFTFVLPSEQNTEQPQTWKAYLHSEEFRMRVVGKSITRQDTEQKAPVLVASYSSLSDSIPKIGTTRSVNGIDFQIIGYYSDPIIKGEIPYTVGLEAFYLREMEFTVPIDATDNQKEALANSIQSAMPGSTVILPAKITQKTLNSMVIPLAAALLVGGNSLITLLFLFKYMLESSRTDFFVLKICGGSPNGLFAMMAKALAAVFTGCFLAGFLLFAAFKSIWRNSPIFAGSGIPPFIVLLVYLISLAIILLAMVPYLARYRKQTLNSGGAL